MPKTEVEAVQEKNGEVYLLVDLGEGRIEKRLVTTGFTDDVYTQIKSGLEQGETVVTSKFAELERRIE